MLRLGLEGAIMAIRVVRNPDKLVFIDRQLGDTATHDSDLPDARAL
jgi:hypothetical protein